MAIDETVTKKKAPAKPVAKAVPKKLSKPIKVNKPLKVKKVNKTKKKHMVGDIEGGKVFTGEKWVTKKYWNDNKLTEKYADRAAGLISAQPGFKFPAVKSVKIIKPLKVGSKTYKPELLTIKLDKKKAVAEKSHGIIFQQGSEYGQVGDACVYITHRELFALRDRGKVLINETERKGLKNPVAKAKRQAKVAESVLNGDDFKTAGEASGSSESTAWRDWQEIKSAMKEDGSIKNIIEEISAKSLENVLGGMVIESKFIQQLATRGIIGHEEVGKATAIVDKSQKRFSTLRGEGTDDQGGDKAVAELHKLMYPEKDEK